MRIKKYNLIVLIFALTQMLISCDPSLLPPETNVRIAYELSDTSAEIHLGDTLSISFQIPNPLLNDKNEEVSYESVKSLNRGFGCFKMGDPRYGRKASYSFLTNEGMNYDCGGALVDFDVSRRYWEVKFIPSDTGWYLFDGFQTGDRLNLNQGKKQELKMGIYYWFKCRNLLGELNRIYPCNKLESDQKVSGGVAYCAIHVIK